MNYSDIYHFIYHNKRSSKQAISNDLQMSLPTVSLHLNTLLDEGFIEKCGQLDSQIGRKAVAYNIIPRAKIALGAEILKTKIIIAAVDLYGDVIEKISFPLIYSNKSDYFIQFSAHVKAFLNHINITKEQILGFGLGLQGLISQDGAKVIYGKVLDCTGLTIDSFQTHLPFPCRFIHDAECAAMNELWGNSETVDALFLSLGYHLGGAIIINGSIHNGRTGRSGTFEHTTLMPGGLECYCGQKGCMECYCSANALLEPNEDLEDFFEKISHQDNDSLLRWQTYLKHLSLAINNLHMTFDSQVILGGHIAPFIRKEDMQFLHNEVRNITAFPEHEDFIFQGQRITNAISVGASLPFLKEFLDNI